MNEDKNKRIGVSRLILYLVALVLALDVLDAAARALKGNDFDLCILCMCTDCTAFYIRSVFIVVAFFIVWGVWRWVGLVLRRHGSE